MPPDTRATLARIALLDQLESVVADLAENVRATERLRDGLLGHAGRVTDLGLDYGLSAELERLNDEADRLDCLADSIRAQIADTLTEAA